MPDENEGLGPNSNEDSLGSDDVEQGLGPKLRAHRAERSLREVAKQAGVNHGYLSQLERGEVAEPAPAILQRLATGYGLPFPVLMRWAGYIESGISANQERALSYLGEDVSDEELRLIRAFLDALRASASFNSLDGDLTEDDITRIRSYTHALIREADSVGLIPTPIDRVMQVAQLVSAGEITLDPQERLKLRHRFGDLVDHVAARLQGVIHFGAREIWINPEMYPLRQRFVLCHEIGHYALPEHRETFAYLDDVTRLRPDVRDLFERQANQASIELLAQGDHLREEADDTPITLELIDQLARRYEISMQAAARRIVEESRQACALAVSFRRSPTSMLTPHHLYCSRTFEERFCWKATASASATIVQTLAQRGPHEPMLTADANGRAAVIAVDRLSTPRAVFALFRMEPVKKRILQPATWSS
jgi:transcriptional regulator with XRE-family HTH domain